MKRKKVFALLTWAIFYGSIALIVDMITGIEITGSVFAKLAHNFNLIVTGIGVFYIIYFYGED